MTKLDEAVEAAIIAGATDEDRVVKAAIQAAVTVLVPDVPDIEGRGGRVKAWRDGIQDARDKILKNAGVE